MSDADRIAELERRVAALEAARRPTAPRRPEPKTATVETATQLKDRLGITPKHLEGIVKGQANPVPWLAREVDQWLEAGGQL